MMLSKASPTHTLHAEAQKYLRETLGVAAQIRTWKQTRKLPYFLQDAFDLNELQLLDQQILLAIERRNRPPTLSVLRTQLGKLAELTQRRIVYVVSTLASYERKRLIQQKAPFIVPGNQLYLPDLGIDLREYFRQRLSADVAAFAPATQALLITALLRKNWQADWQAAEAIAELGYTAMTLSRAIRELTAAGVVALHQEGRSRSLRMNLSPAETWEHARPSLRSPVKRSVWVRDTAHVRAIRPLSAGLNALAQYSMLAEPQWSTYAVSAAQWTGAQKKGVAVLPELQAGARQLQVWTYTPALLKGVAIVDPLSLTLSLQDELDERVQQALNELRAHFPW